MDLRAIVYAVTMAKRSGVRLTKAEGRELTRRRLIAAATRVITERGFQAASIEAICEAAGYTRGAFYSNFASREELLLAVWAEQLAKAVVPSDTPATSIAELRRSVEVARRQATYQEFFLIQMELWQYAVRHPEFRPKLVAEYRRRHDNMVRDIRDFAAGAGLRLPAEPDVLATVLHAYLLGWQLLYEVDGPGGDYDTYFTGLATVYDALAALAAQPTTELPET